RGATLVRGEGYAAEDAWAVADRAIALAQRACERMNQPAHTPATRSTAHRAVMVALALYHRAEAVEKSARTDEGIMP
ncbi:hypothetical protein AB0D37_43375, partial [Streptomyces sp. NPDC048384]|uniref:hypothetical protein n=1 Tax=Streptomyces sp. NPDC048384 TaxID=3155487 RepID=UPI00341811B8